MMFSHTRIPGFPAVAALGVAALLVTAGCSEDDEVQQPEDFAPPSNLTVVNGDEVVTLAWDASPDEALDEFARYFAEGHGRLWERQALCKARVVYGSPRAAEKATSAVGRAAFEHRWRKRDAEEIREMRF